MTTQQRQSGSTTPLPRGSACLNCKRRKIKCDSVKPVCGPCNTSDGFDDCEYPNERPSLTQLLEEDIERMEERIRELEQLNSGGKRNRVELQDPYPALPTISGRGTPSSSSSENMIPSTHVQLPLSLRASSFEEPPHPVRRNLLASFRRRCMQLGFFLQTEQFTAASMLPLPIGHHYRPAPSLMYSVYLWTAHLMPNFWDVGSKDILLKLALQNLNLDLSGNHPSRLMHVLQAETLLSYYFLLNKSNTSAIVHVNSAISLTVGMSLHRLGASTILETSHAGSHHTVDAPECATFREKIFAFWTVVVLSNFLAVLEPSQRSTFYDAPHFIMDTPWPLETSLQSMASTLKFDLSLSSVLTAISDIQILQGSQNKISQFLGGSSDEGTTPLALLAKASILLKKSVYWNHNGPNDVNDAQQLYHFDALTEKFLSDIPLLDQFGSSPCERKTWALARIITRASTIYLHSRLIDTDENARKKCVLVAIGIEVMMKTFKDQEFPEICPLLGPILSDTCSLLVREIARNESSNNPVLRCENEKLRKSVTYILEMMKQLSNVNPSVASSLQRFRESNPNWALDE